ncbi:MAG: PAS domain S-box protein, partial [Planctomycetes bacterium]|nr:PAS domain S-box protein [Planctomycetota bacterium]
RILKKVNQHLCEMLGYSEEELLDRSARILYPTEEDFAWVGKEKYRQIFKHGTGTVETRWIRKDGTLMDVLLSSTPLDLADLSAGVTFTALDITHRKEVERELKASLNRYGSLYESSRDGYAMTTLDGTVIESNSTFQRMLGYTQEELAKLSVYDFTPSRWHEQEKRIVKTEVLERGYSEVFEKEYIRKDGSVFPVEIRVHLLRDERGKPASIWAFVRDITDKKTAAARMHLMSNAVEQSGEGLAVVDLEGNLLFLNQAFARLHGYSMGELIGKHLSIFHGPDQMAAVDAANKELLKNGEFKGEIWHIRRDGTPFPTLMNNAILRNEAGEPVGFIGTVRDITESKRAEEEEKLRQQHLLKADKMISLGILVAGMAHEINNPNHFIMSHSALLAKMWKSIEPILEDYYKEYGDFSVGGLCYSHAREQFSNMFSSVIEGSKRIKGIVDELKDYVREQPSEPSDLIQINRVIRSSITLLTNMVKKSTHRFVVDYGKNLPLFKGNYQRLEQVMINLIQNACQALSDMDQEIRISSRYDRRAQKVIVEIEDQGRGMPPEVADHVLDPFFTTKRETGGTGLGLSISYNIVREHAGKLEISSAQGHGTIVRVELPIKEDTTPLGKGKEIAEPMEEEY